VSRRGAKCWLLLDDGIVSHTEDRGLKNTFYKKKIVIVNLGGAY